MYTLVSITSLDIDLRGKQVIWKNALRDVSYSTEIGLNLNWTNMRYSRYMLFGYLQIYC